MAMISADWSVNKTTQVVDYIGDDHTRFGGSTPSYATVIEFHRWVQGLAHNLTSSGDDEMDMTVVSATDRSTDNIITMVNGWTITDNAAEHLYDGSIIQGGGSDIYDGIVNFGNVQAIQLIQDGALVADDWWNTGSGGLNANISAGISHRFMVKTRDGGSDIDGRRIIGTSRRFNYNFSEFSINGSARGNNVLALSESSDLNNETAEGTVAGWTDIVNDNEGYSGIDADGNSANEFYYADWEYGTRSVNNFYERSKWLTRSGSSETLYGLNGQLFRGVTHEIDIDNPAGTFQEPEPVSWTGGTGQLLAIDSTTAGTKMWIQLLTGVAPTDGQGITGGTSSATADVDITVTERTVSTPFAGQSTGTAIIGAYGVGIGADDLTATDKVTDLTNTVLTPPNNVTFSVIGVVIGEDKVIVGPESGGSLEENQFGIVGSLTTDNITSVQVDAAVPSDTPTSGTIRVQDNNGRFHRLEYSSYSGDTFTISSTDGEEDFAAVNASAANNCYISYIDKVATSTTESFTSVFNSARPLFIRVRDGGGSPIKTFETTGSLGSAGGSATVIRTSDE